MTGPHQLASSRRRDGDGSVSDGDGYDGPAAIVGAGVAIAVSVTLRGHFDPISGGYSWYGRVGASPQVATLIVSGARKVALRTPHAEVPTTLSDVDPWGRSRVAGFGPAPFHVLSTLRGQEGQD